MQWEASIDMPSLHWIKLSDASTPDLGEQYISLDFRNLPSRAREVQGQMVAAVERFGTEVRRRIFSTAPPDSTSIPGSGHRLGGRDTRQIRQGSAPNAPRGYAPVATEDNADS